VLQQQIEERYDWIKAKIVLRNGPIETWEPRGWEYSYRLTLTMGTTDVRHWRATFDVPAKARLDSTAMKIKHHDGRQAYLYSQEDRLITAGKSHDFDFLLWVPQSDKLSTTEIKNLQAVRLD
jgi:hypothetical protein